jgi:hypothetical protein
MTAGNVALVLLLAAGSVALFLLGVKGARLRAAIARWPRVPAVVLEHRIYSHGMGRDSAHIRPQFLVRYTVAGVRYETVCDSPTKAGFKDGRAVKRFQKKYPVNAEVSVYVDPRNAERAFLWLPELSTIVAGLAGSLFMAACIAFVVIKQVNG